MRSYFANDEHDGRADVPLVHKFGDLAQGRSELLLIGPADGSGG